MMKCIKCGFELQANSPLGERLMIKAFDLPSGLCVSCKDEAGTPTEALSAASPLEDAAASGAKEA